MTADDLDLDDEFLEEVGSMQETCNRYLQALPQFYPQQEREPQPCFMLTHDDLNDSNILVDPESYVLTGIIDWEMTCVVPGW